MEGAEILQLLAELAVGVLGFSGVVAVLGRRSAGEWSPVDRSRFFVMVWTTALVLVYSLIPFLLHHGGIAGPPLWGWCSAIAAAAWTLMLAASVFGVGSLGFFSPSRPGVSKLASLYVFPSMFVTPLLLDQRSRNRFRSHIRPVFGRASARVRITHHSVHSSLVQCGWASARRLLRCCRLLLMKRAVIDLNAHPSPPTTPARARPRQRSRRA